MLPSECAAACVRWQVWGDQSSWVAAAPAGSAGRGATGKAAGSGSGGGGAGGARRRAAAASG